MALRRASRAALLVLVATWLRGAAGAEGLREVARRVLGRLRRLPSLPEAAAVLDEIASEGRLAAAGALWWTGSRACPGGPCRCSTPCSRWVVAESAAVRPGRGR